MASNLSRLLAACILALAVAAADQKVLDNPDAAEQPNILRNATLRLFPIKDDEAAAMDGCPDIELGQEISLATETCLSGDYALLDNIRVTVDPTCADGHKATLAVYNHRHCSYPALYDTSRWDAQIPRDCLRPTGSRYWSLIFRCGPWGALKDGAEAGLVDAEPPGREDRLGEPVAGLVKTHFTFDCGGHTVGGNAPMELPVDRCMTFYSNSMQILREPRCANGRRARWARFADRSCGRGGAAVEGGLVDIEDGDIGGACLHASRFGWGMDRVEISSMAFWCDGFGERKA